MGVSSVKLTNHLPKIQGKVETAALQWLEETSGELEAVAKRNTTSASGQTKNSWTHQVDRGAGEAVAGSDLENAIWEEYGTGEFAAEGNGRGSPWFVPVEAVGGGKKPSYNGQVIIVHGKDGKAWYKTNGKKPKKMLHNAWDKVIPKAKKALADKIKNIKP